MDQIVEWMALGNKTGWDWFAFALSVLGAIGGVIWILEKLNRFRARRRAGKDLKSLKTLVEYYDELAAALKDFEANRWGAMAMLIRNVAKIVVVLGLAVILASIFPIGLDVLVAILGIWIALYEFDRVNCLAKAIHGGNSALADQAKRIEDALNNAQEHAKDLAPKEARQLQQVSDRWQRIRAEAEAARLHKQNAGGALAEGGGDQPAKDDAPPVVSSKAVRAASKFLLDLVGF